MPQYGGGTGGGIASGLMSGFGNVLLLKEERDAEQRKQDAQNKRDLLGYLIESARSGNIDPGRADQVMKTAFTALFQVGQEEKKGAGSPLGNLFGKKKGKGGDKGGSQDLINQLLGMMGGGQEAPAPQAAPQVPPGTPPKGLSPMPGHPEFKVPTTSPASPLTGISEVPQRQPSAFWRSPQEVARQKAQEDMKSEIELKRGLLRMEQDERMNLSARLNLAGDEKKEFEATGKWPTWMPMPKMGKPFENPAGSGKWFMPFYGMDENGIPYEVGEFPTAPPPSLTPKTTTESSTTVDPETGLATTRTSRRTTGPAGITPIPTRQGGAAPASGAPSKKLAPVDEWVEKLHSGELTRMDLEGLGPSKLKRTIENRYSLKYGSLPEGVSKQEMTQFHTAEEAYNTAKENTAHPTAAGDVSMGIGFLRARLPRVNVTEVNMVQHAGALGSRIQAMANRVSNGELMDDTMRRELLDQFRTLVESQRATIEKATRVVQDTPAISPVGAKPKTAEELKALYG